MSIHGLLLASYLFYAAWNPPFVILLWLSTLVDYSMALLLGKQENPGKRKALLWVSLLVNLGMLGFFKCKHLKCGFIFHFNI